MTKRFARLHRGDALEWLRTVPDGIVDLVITDVAYESQEKHRLRVDKAGVTRHRGKIPRLVDWFPIFPNAAFAELFLELHRVMARHSHLYFFCDSETMFVAKPMAEAAGFKFWKPLVWDKECIGMGYHYRARCEFILFLEKGKRKLADLGVPDVLRAKRIAGGGAYPTEKPVEIARTLIEQSSSRGQLVIDPFMGSGSVGVAATELGRRFAGCDILERAVEIASRRIEAAKVSSHGA